MKPDPNRRKVLQAATLSIVTVPLALFARQARATQNSALRAQFKYQDTPFQGNECTVCLEFIPGKTAQAAGGCKRIPGDDEISPHGYCVLWNTM